MRRTELPKDIREMVAFVTTGIVDYHPDPDKLQAILLSLCGAVYNAGQAKGIDFAIERSRALS